MKKLYLYDTKLRLYIEHMQYDDIRTELYKVLILPENRGEYKTCTQICEALENNFPQTWRRICDAYSSACGTYGVGGFSPYNAERFVESALKYYSTNNGIPGLEMHETTFTDINNKNSERKTLSWHVV